MGNGRQRQVDFMHVPNNRITTVRPSVVVYYNIFYILIHMDFNAGFTLFEYTLKIHGERWI